MDTIEKKVADTMLQNRQEINIGKDTYQVAPPSLGTLLLVSGIVSELSPLDIDNDSSAFLLKCIMAGKDADKIAKTLATIILGAKAIREDRERKTTIFKKKSAKDTLLDRLTNRIMEDYTPQELYTAMTLLLGGMQLDSFFGLSASLRQQRISKPKNETTAHGRS